MAAALTNLIGAKVVSKDGREIDVSSLAGEGKIVGLYFSAHWCPPCRAFTPQLASFYNDVHKKDKNLEIVFVSLDQERKSFDEYYGSMPWLAMPFDDKYCGRQQLMSKFNIFGIPSLLFIDGATGKVITYDGRAKVQRDLTGANYPAILFEQEPKFEGVWKYIAIFAVIVIGYVIYQNTFSPS